MIATNFAEQNDVLGCGGNKDCFDLPIARAYSPKSVQALGEEKREWEVRKQKAIENNMPFNEPPPNNFHDMVFSFWALEENDLAEIIKNGGIYLGSRGTTHPPIRPYALNPFVAAEVKEDPDQAGKSETSY